MYIGVLIIKLHLPEVHNLKEKRQIIQSLIGRVRSHHNNLSIAEIDYQEQWQSSLIGFACISNEAIHLQKVLTKVFNTIQEWQGDYLLVDHKIEVQKW